MRYLPFSLFIFLSGILCCTKMNRPFSLDYALKGKNSTRPIICGHRGGYDLDFPENSISRFTMDAQACKGSAIMIELDVRKSADGILYILHDESLDRTTTGTGKIRDVTAADINQLFLKTETDSITAERIPTFESVLNWAKQNPAVFLMVDVKGDIWEDVLQMIKEKEVVNKCVILTFSLENTRKVYAISPDIWISTLISTENDFLQIEALPVSQAHLIAYINEKTPAALIEQLKALNIKLTSDVSEHVKKHPSPFPKAYYQNFVADKKLDILITDYPVAVCRLFGR